MSTNSGTPPACDIASVVAINVCGTVTTASPGLTPAAISANLNASVPLPTPTQWRASQNNANAVSNLSTAGPPTKLAVSRTPLNAATNSSLISWCCVTRSKNAILSPPIGDPRLPWLSFRANISVHGCWIAHYHTVGGHVPGDYTAGPDDCVLANREIGEDCGSRPY